jgi:hypothetical protein
MGVISQAPELPECEIGITLFGYPRDRLHGGLVTAILQLKGLFVMKRGLACC